MKYTLAPGATSPTRATEGSAGYDLAAYIPKRTRQVKFVQLRGLTVIRTGVSVAIPTGYVGLVYVRSSLGARGLMLTHGTGVIDSDYRGEIILKLTSYQGTIEINQGDRIAQLVIVPIFTPELEQVETLDEPEREQESPSQPGNKPTYTKRNNKRTTATKLREIDNGRQAEYRLDQPITVTELGMSMEVTHLISSHSILTGLVGYETMFFPSDGNGSIINYMDLYYMPGHVDHDVAVQSFLEENTHEQTPNYTHQPCTHLGTQKPGEQMSMTIQDIIVRLRSFGQYASPAPWSVTPYQLDKDTACWVVKDCEESVICSRISDHRPQADFEFIRESRNAIPALIAEIERLKAENAKTWEDGYKFAANSYYDDISEPDDFAQEARANSPYKKEK